MSGTFDKYAVAATIPTAPGFVADFGVRLELGTSEVAKVICGIATEVITRNLNEENPKRMLQLPFKELNALMNAKYLGSVRLPRIEFDPSYKKSKDDRWIKAKSLTFGFWNMIGAAPTEGKHVAEKWGWNTEPMTKFNITTAFQKASSALAISGWTLVDDTKDYKAGPRRAPRTFKLMLISNGPARHKQQTMSHRPKKIMSLGPRIHISGATQYDLSAEGCILNPRADEFKSICSDHDAHVPQEYMHQFGSSFLYGYPSPVRDDAAAAAASGQIPESMMSFLKGTHASLP
jgi:hypothetical protein